VRLQVKTGDHLSAHETAEECRGITDKLIRRAQALKDQHPIWCDQELYIYHDRASFFMAIEDMPEGYGETYKVIVNPPKSPDCAKIIEHPIHAIKRMFAKEFTQMVGKVGAHRAMQLLEECVEAAVTIKGIRDDVLTLPATLKEVFARKGNWAWAPLA